MRTDLTANFQTEMARAGRAPVQLLAIYFAESGTVRVSDRQLGPADGLTNTWAGLVEDWGFLQDVTAADPGEVSIEARQTSVTLINRGTTPFSDYFLKEDPENVTADLYQWFEGLAESDLILIDRFIIADPIRFSERGRLVTLDLVSAIVAMDNPISNLLSLTDWPNAKDEDIGKAIDIPIGDCGRLPALVARTAPAATLNGSILSNTATIATHENLDTLGFSAAGTLQIGEELVRYSSRSAYQFTVSQRGYQSTAAEHLDRAEIVELITDHTFIIGRGPVNAIDEVQVGGFPAPAGIYSVAADTDPAKIIFNQKPYAYRFAGGSTFLQMQFDTIGADNTAYQAYKAYDSGDDATAAKINPTYPRLSLKQTTINPDLGAIVKAYLAVEHWESDTIVNDYAEVWVEGIGAVGRLSRPNPEEGIEIDADVDIDHGHNHAIGGEHSHTFYDPVLQTTEEVHTHLTSDSGNKANYPPDEGQESFTLTAPVDPGATGEYKYVYFHNVPKVWSSARLKCSVALGGTRLKIGWVYVADGAQSVAIGARNSTSTTYMMNFNAYGNDVYYAEATIWNVTLEVITETTILGAETGANTTVAISGSNAKVSSDKKVNDVQALATNNATVNINTTAASTKSHVDLFDLTPYVNFDWSWFNDRDIKVTYTGAADSQSIYVLHCFFDVEYRKRERFFSDDVTAEVNGLIDDSAGTYTGTAGQLITRPDHVIKKLLIGTGNMAAADIDTTSFDAAGARLDAKGYTIDGVLRGDLTTKEAMKKVAFQSRTRPFFSAGKAKCRFVEAFDDWTYSKEITAADYQLNSISIERQAARAVINRADLFYARTWTNDEDGPAGFEKSTRASSARSIDAFGIRTDGNKFLFDLVRAPAMAADLVQYYVDRLAFPSSYYTINGYLALFALEKEDKIKLTASFNRLSKTPMRILGVNRQFGSGKNNTINFVSLLLESLRYLLLDQSAESEVKVNDALDIAIGLLGNFSENIYFSDAFVIAIGQAMADQVTMADILESQADYRPSQTETATITDQETVGLNIGISDPVNVIDDVDGWRQFGFGGGNFGVVGFGGWTVWYNRAPDEQIVFDDLAADLDQGAIAETVTPAETLVMSSGFGCPVGSGFGATYFGD